jgi:predicted amidohydrolase YtcJ
MRSIFTWPILALLLACGDPGPSQPEQAPVEPAQLVIRGANIVTVDPATQGATAVAVRGEEIVAVGSAEQLAAYVGEQTRVVELGERALLPGFIDAHGHLGMVMRMLTMVNLSSPPVGSVGGVDDIVALLKARIEEQKIAPGQWVMGYGYDDSLLAEGRHPNRDDLDRASSEHPIALVHVSGHLATLNSAALAASGLDASSDDPPGGVIRRRSGSREPNGVLEETAAAAVFYAQMAAASTADYPGMLRRAIEYHAAYGITTIQDGASNPQDIAAIRAIAAQQPLLVDVAAYPHTNAAPIDMPLSEIGYSPDYEGGFRVAGAKLVIDGSPQGRTAWMSEPYLEGPPGAPADYVAYPIVDPDHYKAWAARLIGASIPMIAHANGDAAIELMIDGVAEAVGDARPDHRAVAIHAQLIREDQLDRVADLGIVPSYLGAHPFFWGDWHRVSFGDERALRISPMRSTIDRGIPFTIHNDAPIVPPDVMRLLWIMVNRETRSGFVLGADQRGTVEEAIAAVTLGGAYQYFEEDRKGSITPGKRADLVILERDPRSAPPAEIKDIGIIETIARGETVYSAP